MQNGESSACVVFDIFMQARLSCLWPPHLFSPTHPPTHPHTHTLAAVEVAVLHGCKIFCWTTMKSTPPFPLTWPGSMSMKNGLSGRVCVCSCACIHTCVCRSKKYAHICVCPIQHAHIHLTRTKHAKSGTFRMQGSRCQRRPGELKSCKSPMPFAKHNTPKIPKPSLSGFMGSLLVHKKEEKIEHHHIVLMCSLSSTLTSSSNTCNTCMMLPQAKQATGCPKDSFAFFASVSCDSETVPTLIGHSNL